MIENNSVKQITKKPKWLRVKLPTGKKYTELRGLVDKYNLNTICTSGSCPNMGECWGEGTATFMILGNICTRSCGFCGVKTGRPETVDWDEPEKVARSIKIMNIKHAVLTSVDRDDLKDMGSIFEAGYMNCLEKPIVYFCDGLPPGAQFNLMLAASGVAVCTSLKQLDNYLADSVGSNTLVELRYEGEIE